MTTSTFFTDCRERIELARSLLISDFVSQKVRQAPLLQNLLAYFIEANKGGKLARGVAVCLGYRLAGGYDIDKVIQAAVGYEVFQTSILAHDDIIDKSTKRRDVDSIWAYFQKIGHITYQLGEEDSKHYGIAQTIALGDIGLMFATELVLKSAFDFEVIVQAVSNFIDTIITTGLGEMLDVELPYINDQNGYKYDDITSVNLLKTARYTCVGPLQLGAILGGASYLFLEKLADIGNALGVAFQIKDDLLIFGNNKEGKDTFLDITEGKKTVLSYYAQNSDLITTSEKVELESYRGRDVLNFDERSRIVELLRKSQAQDKCVDTIQKLTSQANVGIEGMNLTNGNVKLFKDYADLLLKAAG